MGIYCKEVRSYSIFEQSIDYNEKMSAEQLPVIQKLREQQEKESYESREKYRKSLGSDKSGKEDESERHIDEADKKTEVKILVEEGKILEKRTSIFASRNENENKTNIFANSKSVNLLNLPKQDHQSGGINIFTMAAVSKPLLQKDPEDDLVSHSSEAPDDNSNLQVLPEPSEKVMKYAYEERTVKIAEFKVAKFKHGSSTTKTNLIVSLEREKQKTLGLLQLIARTDATKIVLYQGWLPTHSNVQSFMGREENLKITAIHPTQQQQTIKYQKQTIKLQFQSLEDSKRFTELITGNNQDELREKNETNEELKEKGPTNSETKVEVVKQIEAKLVEQQKV